MKNDNFGEKLPKKEARNLAARFEAMLQGTDNLFLAPDGFESIIEFYEDEYDFDMALRVTDYALHQYPYSSCFLLKKAQFVNDSGKCLEALDLLDRAELLSPGDMEAMLLRTEIYTELKRYGDALEVLESLEVAAYTAEDKLVVNLALSDVCEALGDMDRAFCVALDALQISPTNEDALCRMDYLVDITERYAEGVEIHAEILEEHPFCHLAWYNKAGAFFGLGLYERAIDAYEYAIAIKPDFEEALQDCGEVAYEAGKHELAFQLYVEALGCSEAEGDLHYQAALCLFELDRFDEALVYCRKALESDMMLPCDAWFLMGECYECLGRYDTAFAHYNNALKADENNVEYSLAIADLHFGLEDFGNAAAHYLKAFGLMPNDDTAYSLKRCVFSLLQLGRTDEATSLLNDAMHTDGVGEFAVLDYLLAACLWQKGSRNEAKVVLQQALENDYDAHEAFLEILPHLAQNHELLLLLDLHRK